MSGPGRGRADYLALGDWNTVCAECGHKFKASVMRKHWKGYWVCPEHWEPREAQDFVKAIPDNQTPAWTQPEPADTFIYFCTLDSSSDIPALAVPGCAIPGLIPGGFDYTLATPDCLPWIIVEPEYIAPLPSPAYLVCTVVILENWLQIDGTLRIS